MGPRVARARPVPPQESERANMDYGCTTLHGERDRARGEQVQAAVAEGGELQARLRATGEALAAGVPLQTLSRRGAAQRLLSVACDRPLRPGEAQAIEAVLLALEADAACARQALRQVAHVIGEPGVEADPELCAARAAEHFECLRAERQPADPELRALMRAASGLSPTDKRRIRELAEAIEGDAEMVNEALNVIVSEALRGGHR